MLCMHGVTRRRERNARDFAGTSLTPAGQARRPRDGRSARSGSPPDDEPPRSDDDDDADRPWSSAKEDTRRVPRRGRHASPGDEPKAKVKAVDVATCPVATGLPGACLSRPRKAARARLRDGHVARFPPRGALLGTPYSSNMYGRSVVEKARHASGQCHVDREGLVGW